MPPNHDSLPYQVLVIDDQAGPSGSGTIMVDTLNMGEFEATHVRSPNEARALVGDEYYDILVIDVELGTAEDGVDLLENLRSGGVNQPVILATGQPEALSSPVRRYLPALELGPTFFYDKNDERIDVLEIARKAAVRVDPLERALRLLQDSGFSEEITVGGSDGDERVTIDDILTNRDSSEALSRALRESLNVLLFELATDGERNEGAG